MSATIGLGMQPLHTDGAHLTNPPDVIVLFSALPSSTATVYWEPTDPTLLTKASSGIFTVRTQVGSFLSSARTGHVWRYDRECMSPADRQAQDVAAAFAQARESATKFEWDQNNTFLMLNNKRMLHARDEVFASDAERVLERLTLNWDTAPA